MIKEVFIPKDLKDLWNRVKSFDGKIKYIAGGTDIVPNIRLYDVDMLIDITHIKELSDIRLSNDYLYIGAAVRISELEKSNLVKKYASAIYKSIKYYASPSIRNIATLGGNLANASPCADGVLALVAVGAKVILNLHNKRKIIPVENVICGVKKTIIRKGEIIEGFLVPISNKKASFIKIMPRSLFGIAKAGLCITAYVNDGFLYDVRVACSSVAPRVILALNTSSYLEGKKIDSEVIKKAKDIVLCDITPITDHRSTKDYRKTIISVMLERAIKELLHD